MKRFSGVLIATIALALSFTVAELSLRALAPVPDPYDKYKHSSQLNPYIRFEFPANYRLETQAEEGLPGVQGHNLFTTNNMGFRGDFITRPKPPREFRIFMVGGSTTECLYLDDSNALNSILQKALREHTSADIDVKVYGTGQSGQCIDDHISMIVHRLVHLEPDMLVVFCGINDLTKSIFHYDYAHYEKATARKKYPLLMFVSTEFQIPRRLYYLAKQLFSTDRQTLEEITGKSAYRKKIELRKSVPESNERPRTDVDSYGKNLKTIIGVARAHSIRLVFITQQTTWNSSVDPEAKKWHWMRYRDGKTYREDLMDEALESFNNAMRQLGLEHSVPVYDLARQMPKSLEFFYDDVHFNVKGAQTAGKGLASFILEKNVIPNTLPQ
jgi:lysophospholipase L1-like esterase